MIIVKVMGQEILEMMESVRPVAGRWAVVLFACSLLVAAAAFIDMWCGIEAARANKEPISSRGLRKTVSKILDYMRVVVFAVLVDALGLFFTWYELPYIAMLCTLSVMLIEGKSVIENNKRKRSHAADIVDMAGRIVGCMTNEEAERLIKLIKENGGKKSTGGGKEGAGGA